MLGVVFQIAVGFLYANLFEWAWHKYVFHGLGKNKSSFFSEHWKDHHRIVRKTGGYDSSYQIKVFRRGSSTTEIVELFVAAMLHLPLIFLFPVFTTYLFVHCAAYFFIHRKCHLDPEWSKKYVPWHWDHHMGKNQDSNWCVTLPFWDHVLRTRLYSQPQKDYNISTQV